jgi:hypothetical protein
MEELVMKALVEILCPFINTLYSIKCKKWKGDFKKHFFRYLIT